MYAYPHTFSTLSQHTTFKRKFFKSSAEVKTQQETWARVLEQNGKKREQGWSTGHTPCSACSPASPLSGCSSSLRPCSSEHERINKSNGNLRKTSQREKAGRKWPSPLLNRWQTSVINASWAGREQRWHISPLNSASSQEQDRTTAEHNHSHFWQQPGRTQQGRCWQDTSRSRERKQPQSSKGRRGSLQLHRGTQAGVMQSYFPAKCKGLR